MKCFVLENIMNLNRMEAKRNLAKIGTSVNMVSFLIHDKINLHKFLNMFLIKALLLRHLSYKHSNYL